MDEGYIKFRSERLDGAVAVSPRLEALADARTRLFDLGLVGAYANGVGYGNVSLRDGANAFIISASATGATRVLGSAQFCLVEAFSISGNWVRARGTQSASSESMTHGAIYAADAAVQCVIHVHSRLLFDTLLRQGAAATPACVAYGTPAMAQAVIQLVAAQRQYPVIFAMTGHAEGVVAYGTDCASVLSLLIEQLQACPAATAPAPGCGTRPSTS
ncbi:MAG: class II aldolase/adducin family protein [Rhodoferax sp.]